MDSLCLLLLVCILIPVNVIVLKFSAERSGEYGIGIVQCFLMLLAISVIGGTIVFLLHNSLGPMVARIGKILSVPTIVVLTLNKYFKLNFQASIVITVRYLGYMSLIGICIGILFVFVPLLLGRFLS